VDSFTRTDTQKNTVQKKRHRKRQKQYNKRSEMCMQQWKVQKHPGVSYHIKSKGVDAGCGVISVCSCVNEEECHAAKIRWTRERSFLRGKVRQKGKTETRRVGYTGKFRKCRLKSDSDDVETG